MEKVIPFKDKNYPGVIGYVKISYVCTKCKRDHKVDSRIGTLHKQYSRGWEGEGYKFIKEK